MATEAAAEKELLDAIAEEVASSVETAVDRWMAEFESVLQDTRLTTFGRLQAMNAIVARYHQLRKGCDLAQHSAHGVASCGFC